MTILKTSLVCKVDLKKVVKATKNKTGEDSDKYYLSKGAQGSKWRKNEFINEPMNI